MKAATRRRADGRGARAGIDKAAPQGGLFPIRTVSTLTGVNSVTLRAWERRYGLLKPHRTAKGHRLYTREDIDLIHRAVELLDQGIPISRVLPLLVVPQRALPGGDEHQGEPWRGCNKRMLSAIARFDEAALEAEYNEALSLYPVTAVTERLLIPLLRTLGERWESEPAGVAQEHFFSLYLRNKLGARLHHRTTRGGGPRLVAACLPGERHDMGLLLFCLSAISCGYRLILLGADTPLEDICVVVRRSASDGIILSATVDPPAALLERDLPASVGHAAVPVFLGGMAAIRHRDALVRAGALPVGADFGAALRRLQEVLPVHPALPAEN